MEKHIAVDIGSSNGKILLGEITNERKLEFQEIARFETPRLFYQNHLCINIYGIYNEILDALSKLGRENIHITSLGVDTWATDFGIINQMGLIQGLPVFYRDGRTKDMVNFVEAKMDYEELYTLTTQRKLKESSLLQILALMKENDKALINGEKLLFLGDLLMYMLTGTIATEITVASYSQAFSMQNRTWEDAVFDVFGIPKSIQAPIVNPGDTLGKIQTMLAKCCHINQFEVIAPAVHDTSSAVAALPVEAKRNWAFIATGTWFLIGMELSKPADAHLSYKNDLSNTGLAFGKTMLKKNVTAMWIIQECKKIWNQTGIMADFPQILDATEKAVPFAGMIDTDAAEFFNPQNMAAAIVKYLERTQGVTIDADNMGQIARIVYESVAFKCAEAIEVLKKVTKKKVDIVYIVGGTSSISMLNQFIANAANVEVKTGPKEASGVGNLLMQAYGCGEVAGKEEISEIVRSTFRAVRFLPEDRKLWAKQLQKFEKFASAHEEE